MERPGDSGPELPQEDVEDVVPMEPGEHRAPAHSHPGELEHGRVVAPVERPGRPEGAVSGPAIPDQPVDLPHVDEQGGIVGIEVGSALAEPEGLGVVGLQPSQAEPIIGKGQRMIGGAAQGLAQGFGSQGEVVPPEMLEAEVEGSFGARIRSVVLWQQSASHRVLVIGGLPALVRPFCLWRGLQSWTGMEGGG